MKEKMKPRETHPRDFTKKKVKMNLKNVRHKSQVKPRKKDKKFNGSVIKHQVDEIYEQLTRTRGGLLPIAHALLRFHLYKRQNKIPQLYAAKAARYSSRRTGWANMHKLANGYFMMMKRNRYSTEDGMRDEPCTVLFNPAIFTAYGLKKLGKLLPILYEFFTLAILISEKYNQQTCTPINKRYPNYYFHPAVTLSLEAILHTFSQRKEDRGPPSMQRDDRASPLRGSDAHAPIYNSKTSTKGKKDDYEAIAAALGAATDI